MLVTERKSIQREIYVAPCLNCNHAEILLSDCNYSSFNQGGGECKKCGHKSYTSVGCNPTMDELATIWNAGNDISTLIRVEEAKILDAKKCIDLLNKKSLVLLSESEKEDCLMMAEDYIRTKNSCSLTSGDGTGVWATATQKSNLSVISDRPSWATHVVWYAGEC